MRMLLMALVLLWPSTLWALDLGKATFSWTASVVDATHGAPTSYTLKCGTAAGGPYALTLSVPVPATSTAVKNLVTTAGTYFCVVTALNAGGESPASNEVTFQGAWAPSPPATLQVQ